MFIETTFKDQKKKKNRKRNYVLKCNLYLYFLIKEKLLFPSENILMSA